MAPSARCQPCADLTVKKLFLLTNEEFSGQIFPLKAYYQHHACFSDLERAANDGCDLCQFILLCFKGAVRDDYTWPSEWMSGPDASTDFESESASMYAAAKKLEISDVKLALDSSTAFVGDESVCVFDIIVVQVGRTSDAELDSKGSFVEADDEDAFWEQRVPPLRLTMSSPRGEPWTALSSTSG